MSFSSAAVKGCGFCWPCGHCDSDVSIWLRSFSWSLSFKSVSRLGVGGLLFLDEDEDFFLLLMVL